MHTGTGCDLIVISNITLCIVITVNYKLLGLKFSQKIPLLLILSQRFESRTFISHSFKETK